ncbi:hypothetical protein DSO57_1038332 [Entomophthora muscae]|uniref:Uncharacterized protein n=1 Tax=Entomophthora muscae TaxID=34485 RepID=A0ACC2S0V3_9FUNG|nr:hypothetical protein DSO57_1038332 [Entomophthora muscae]
MRLFLGLFSLVACQQQCSRIDVRREIRDLSPGERQAFFNAISALARTRSTGGLSIFDSFAKIHVDNQAVIHNAPIFLPWHRHFVHVFQTELRRINPSIVIPYWDTSIDSQQPERSPIFSPAFFGGTGNPANGYCVPDGPFRNLRVRVDAETPNGQAPHCLRRNFDGGTRLSPFSPIEVINQITSINDFSTFTSQLERGPHAHPHNNIGGDNGHLSTMASPNDPLFWVHHANVDYWYSTWQQSAGRNVYIPGQEGAPLPYYNNVRVQDTLNTEAFPYCYRYAPRGSSQNQPTPPPPSQELQPPLQNRPTPPPPSQELQPPTPEKPSIQSAPKSVYTETPSRQIPILFRRTQTSVWLWPLPAPPPEALLPNPTGLSYRQRQIPIRPSYQENLSCMPCLHLPRCLGSQRSAPTARTQTHPPEMDLNEQPRDQRDPRTGDRYRQTHLQVQLRPQLLLPLLHRSLGKVPFKSRHLHRVPRTPKTARQILPLIYQLIYPRKYATGKAIVLPSHPPFWKRILPINLFANQRLELPYTTFNN